MALGVQWSTIATPAWVASVEVWICNDGEGGIAYTDHTQFLKHEEEDCYATL